MCDELELGWRQKAFTCLRANRRKRVLSPWPTRRGKANAMAASASLGTWATLNALGLRKIVKKFDKACSSRHGKENDPSQGAGWASSARNGGAAWMQRVALPRLSFLQSALRVELFALAALAHPAAQLSGSGAGPKPAAPADSPDEAHGGAKGTQSQAEAKGAAAGVILAMDERRFDRELSCAAYVEDLTSCQLCLEVMVQPVAFAKCGHPICCPCFARMAAATTAGTVSRCPLCRSTSQGVALVQLKRLAKARKPAEYSHRRGELRVEGRAARVATVHATARSFFLTHADLLVLASGSQPATPSASAQQASPAPAGHLARLFPPPRRAHARAPPPFSGLARLGV